MTTEGAGFGLTSVPEIFPPANQPAVSSV